MATYVPILIDIIIIMDIDQSFSTTARVVKLTIVSIPKLSRCTRYFVQKRITRNGQYLKPAFYSRLLNDIATSDEI